MKILRILLVFIVLGVLLVIPIPVGASPILHESFTTAGDTDSATIYGGYWRAEQFTSEATSHSVTSIKVELKRGGTPSSVTVGLWNAAAGVPTTEITSVTYAGTILSTAYTMYEFDIADVSLLPSTEYAVVVSCSAGDAANYVMWHKVAGGGLANAIGNDSGDSGVTWANDAGADDYLFEIYGDVVFQVLSANVVQDYLVTGDWLIVIETINSYPEYITQDPERYFNVQMLNVAGTAVIGATTLKSWGDSPCAIYLNPTIVATLTVNSAYIIRMIGTFTGTPSTTYTLQHSATYNDWVGSDLRYLDSWCIKTARNMNSSYVTTTSVGGLVLTTEGGGAFVDGIPSIMAKRPDLFESSVHTPDPEIDDTANNAYDAMHTWQAQVGAPMTADATAWGTVFGVTGKQFLSMGIWAFYLFAMLFTFASSKGSETVFVMMLCAPVLFIGTHFRILEYQVVAVMAVFALLLFVIKMWFTK